MVTDLRPSLPPTRHSSRHTAGSDQSWHGRIAPGGIFPPEKGRYRLYIGLHCGPFAHRVNLVRHLKGLEMILPVTVVTPYANEEEYGGSARKCQWQFPCTPDDHGSDDENLAVAANSDPLFGSRYLHELYFKADPSYRGRYSVPVLWDMQASTIVNNESAELVRDLQTAFNSLLPEPLNTFTLCPPHLENEIDWISEWMQRDLHTGVYRAGLAKTQELYDAAVPKVFAALNVLEKVIYANGGPYILGDTITELDVSAYATLIRFDVVYVQHFKCNLGMIRHDYPQIQNWLSNLYYNVRGFKETTDFKSIKENYTKMNADINPSGITPMGPYPDVEGAEGFHEKDLEKVGLGGIRLPIVLKAEAELGLGW
ncbi:glutathione S-transferase Gst3, variant [Bombardia bombarda]|uniref:Glutathione S-transferase Gst3, variant n=1 Tax=Bombardia bombarda TaxID=252184 RepID=A0AA39WCN7_9PEZI|nr:glutathione S-transferase Gst3, variant [Bombardia bombarda]